MLCIELDAYKSWTPLVNYVENMLQNCGDKYRIIFVTVQRFYNHNVHIEFVSTS